MRTRLACLAAALALNALVWLLCSVAGGPVTGVLDPAHMKAEQGKAVAVPLRTRPAWWLTIPNDGAGISTLRLFEVEGAERRPLGPASAPLERVRESGGGAFNHWGEILLSSSDGSDPRANGRRYEWESDTVLHPRLRLPLLIVTAAALLWTLSGWFSRTPRARVWTLAAVFVAILVSWNIEAQRLYPGWINVDWDTSSYLGRSPERTIGYPLMLDAVSLLTGDLRLLLVIQLNAMLGSFFVLAIAIDRLLRSRVTGLAIFILLATSPRLMTFPFNVLTEAPYVTGMCLLLALLCEAARWRSGDAVMPSVRWRMAILALVGATLAMTELVRPAAFGLAAAALLPVLWARGERLRALAAIALPYLLIIAAASWANERRYGIFATSSMGPVSVLGNIAWNIRAETCPTLPELAERIERRVAPVLARRPADLPWPKEYFFWTSDEYNELLWANAMPETQAWVEERERAGLVDSVPAELRRVRGTLAREALRAAPVAYAWHVGAHVWGFWQSVARPGAIGPALKGRVLRSASSVANLWPEVRERRFGWMGSPPEVNASDTAFDRLTWMERWRWAIDANPTLLWRGALLATLAGLVMAPFSRRLTSAGRLLALAGTGFQGTALLVAVATAVIARYVDAVEPLTIVACAAGITAIGEFLSTVLRPRPR